MTKKKSAKILPPAIIKLLEEINARKPQKKRPVRYSLSMRRLKEDVYGNRSSCNDMTCDPDDDGSPVAGNVSSCDDECCHISVSGNVSSCDDHVCK